MISIGIDFEFNSEFICTSVLFKKYQNLGKYNLRFFEKHASANKFRIERENLRMITL